MHGHHRSTEWTIRIPLVALLLGTALLPRLEAAEGGADSPGVEIERQAAALRQHLDAYGRRGGGNTIPIEQAIIALRDLGASAALLEHVSHPRFGGTVVWALAAIGDPDVTGKVLTELEGVDPERRIEASFHLAACGTPGVLEWIRALAGREGLEAEQEETLREALLRAGDPAVLEETRAALQDDAPEVVAGALRILGESRNLSLLEEIVRHVDDDTDITALELRSRFARKTTSTDDRGWTTERTEYPALSTLGDVALEAVNRLHAPTTPEYIAWWYEVLPTPWFTGEDARKRLRAYLEADRRARAAGAVSGARALEALVHALRPELQHRQVSRLGFEFDEEGWVIHLEVDGASRQRRISPAGEVRD